MPTYSLTPTGPLNVNSDFDFAVTKGLDNFDVHVRDNSDGEPDADRLAQFIGEFRAALTAAGFSVSPGVGNAATQAMELVETT